MLVWFKLLHTIFCVLIITSSFLNYYEDKESSFMYFYFMIVSFSTVGFGDITAKTEVGKVNF